MSPLLPINADRFDVAAKEVLRFLRDHSEFGLWMVTRVEGDDWIVLETEDRVYGVKPEQVFRWSDSFCRHMVAGRGPRVAPRSADVPAYAQAPINRLVKIESYVGVPLNRADGTLFGTLCAIDPNPQAASIEKVLPLVELLAALLSGLLKAELKFTEALRRAERAESEAECDALTTLYNRRGWNRLLDVEESRCRRYGHPACVVMIDLDGLKNVNDSFGHAAGDEFISRAGRAILSVTRQSDLAARVGGDEFAVLGTECNVPGASALIQNLRKAFQDGGVPASFGLAMRTPGKGLRAAWKEADVEMYADKAAKSNDEHHLPQDAAISTTQSQTCNT